MSPGSTGTEQHRRCLLHSRCQGPLRCPPHRGMLHSPCGGGGNKPGEPTVDGTRQAPFSRGQPRRSDAPQVLCLAPSPRTTPVRTTSPWCCKNGPSDAVTWHSSTLTDCSLARNRPGGAHKRKKPKNFVVEKLTRLVTEPESEGSKNSVRWLQVKWKDTEALTWERDHDLPVAPWCVKMWRRFDPDWMKTSDCVPANQDVELDEEVVVSPRCGA